MVLIRMNIF